MALTGHTLPVGVGLAVACVGVGGGAAVHSPQQGAQVAHRNLLYERGPILPEIPPLKDLSRTQETTPSITGRLRSVLEKRVTQSPCSSSQKKGT